MNSINSDSNSENIFRLENKEVNGTYDSINFNGGDDSSKTRRDSDDNVSDINKSAPAPEEHDPPCTGEEATLNMSLLHEIIFVLLVSSSQVLGLAGAVQGIPQMDVIVEWFKLTHPSDSGWCNGGYATTYGSFVLIAGKMGDMNGHKSMFLIGYAWLALWSLLTGFSRYCPSSHFFFFCRAAQGIGAAFTFTSALSILGKSYPPCKRKNFIFSFFGACGSFGVVLGMVFSALFTQLAHWSWAYWSMAIACVVIIILSIFFIPGDVVEKHETSNVFYFDYLGAFLFVTGLVLFSVAWNQAPTYGFGRTYVYVLLIVSVVILALAMYVETKVDDPLLPWTHISANTLKVLLAIFFAYASFTMWAAYTFRFNLMAKGDTLLLAAAKMTPMAVSGVFAALFSALLLNIHVQVQIRMLISLLAFLVPPILMATMGAGQTYWGEVFVTTIVISFGLDISFPSATLLLSNRIPDKFKGLGASLVGAVLNYATALGPPTAASVLRYQCPDCMAHKGNAFTKTINIIGYVGIGTAGLGTLVAIFGVITEYPKVAGKKGEDRKHSLTLTTNVRSQQ
ncbi:uncharacterized protein KNAG_0D00130 [Huiozyma naganishii CBS 8797]|uniref:Major facilitator superfamily (MFS) profile domain-containing protein n=1 Tax=Huiozyma naganishii (strain ATCC MYA-139 / BCRC 22969 / CBS 8797 / KCTC 17520 / NBRC 10181 / NCYC 3082 / Yp74L-3) TaxID=1071383 RepID=J7R4J0_HUIN7|nr:hypothetical protein KNAG_0D00130 [Kazachstania naganishii CBS 8797]CCK69765.1 hypothetical protein KNAG_0D00130 [Kazachstania naganishii CBS 8797]